MTGFSTAKAELLPNASFAFFWGKLGDFDGIDDHSIGVVGLRIRGVREGVVVLMGSFGIPFGDVVDAFPLGLKGNCLLVPFIDGGGDGVHGHDSTHEGWWDSSGEVSD